MPKPIDPKYQLVMRGEAMSRVETFVAAAFAFAVTMIMFSIGNIPTNMDAFLISVKNIPSFLASCAVILWIWHSHANWSRWFGLEDGRTIFFSGTLISIVLIYIYPLRLMMQGLFYNISGHYLPFELEITAYWHLRFLFIFYALGFILLCANFYFLYRYARSKSEKLALSEYELFEVSIKERYWLATMGVNVIVLTTSVLLPDKWMVLSPNLYVLFFPTYIYLNRRYDASAIKHGYALRKERSKGQVR